MKAPFNSVLAAIGGCIIALTAAAGSAIAGCPCAPPPPCCTPPQPPSPPHIPCCAPPSSNILIPGVSVVVAPTVVVNAQAQAQASVLAGAQAGAAVFVGGGGNAGYIGPGPVGLISGMNVGAEQASYESTRTKIKKVIIEVVCIDDKTVPHPGSQVTPDREIGDSYEGELYRCIAGTHMRVTFAEWNEGLSFEHGWTLDCNKNEALYHSAGGKVECRVQKPARDCNERSLLRRFGAGIKILTMITIEKYTAYREQTTSTSMSMSIDGGVGGVVY